MNTIKNLTIGEYVARILEQQLYSQNTKSIFAVKAIKH